MAGKPENRERIDNDGSLRDANRRSASSKNDDWRHRSCRTGPRSSRRRDGRLDRRSNRREKRLPRLSRDGWSDCSRASCDLNGSQRGNSRLDCCCSRREVVASKRRDRRLESGDGIRSGRRSVEEIDLIESRHIRRNACAAEVDIIVSRDGICHCSPPITGVRS